MKKKKRVKIKTIIVIVIILLLIGLGIYIYFNLRIKNIYVKGNNLLKESEILKDTNLLEYPKIIDVNTKEIENIISKNKLVNTVKVNKSVFGKVIIEVEENIPLFRNRDNSYTLSNGEIYPIDVFYNVPILVSDVDSQVLNDFIKAVKKIKHDILIKISEIEYKNSEYDKERFLFLMNDGNYVYVTISRIELINSYNEIYPTLENHKGILHLDSGNHFEIKE